MSSNIFDLQDTGQPASPVLESPTIAEYSPTTDIDNAHLIDKIDIATGSGLELVPDARLRTIYAPRRNTHTRRGAASII